MSFFMMSVVEKSLAVVTGASRGLGAAIALDLAKRGFEVLLVARHREFLELQKERILGLLPEAKVHLLSLDLLDPEAPKKLFEEVDRLDLILRILVNNAGAIRVRALQKTSIEDWDLQMRLNATVAFETSSAALRRMGEGPGVILNIASLAGIQSETKFPGFSAYSASKSALVGFSQALASELEDQKIAILCVAPGAIDTQMLKEALPDFKTTTLPEDVSKECMKLIDEAFTEGDFTFKLIALTNQPA